MAGRTPNLDRLANEGVRFTDYYAEASCTAGRANFITGEIPLRTGLTTVGQAGSPIGMPAQAPTIATALKSMGYATGQFGKNHLGDLNQFLPTVHGFDEFFGYLYHLDAMEDHRASVNYPQELQATSSARATWSTPGQQKRRRPDGDAALGQGRQAADRGCRRRSFPLNGWKTVDDEIQALNAFKFIDKAKARGQEALLPLAEPDAHAHRHPSLGQV